MIYKKDPETLNLMLQAYYDQISNVYLADFPHNPPITFNSRATYTGGFLSMMGTWVRVLDYNSTVEIVFQETSLLFFESHPIHLHRQNFYIVESGFCTYNPLTDPTNFNLVDPSCFETHLCCSSRAIRSISMDKTST